MSKTIVTLDTCNPINGVEVLECKTETQLIKTFEAVFRRENADIVTGYNVLNFDFPYIVNRANKLKIETRLGRAGEVCTVKETSFSSNQRGSSTSYSVAMSGRIIFDMLPIIRNDVGIKLRYTCKCMHVNVLVCIRMRVNAFACM